MFYDNYVALCQSKGLSPTGAATTLGIGRATVSRWKNEGMRPQTEHLRKIADYFDVSIDYLLGIEKAATLSDDGYSEKKKSLLKAVEQMTEEQAELLLSLWEQFKAGR